MKKNKLSKQYSKYFLYENSVQSPKEHVAFLDAFYKRITGRLPNTLREDFCGTFAICSEWVKGGPKRRATGLDLDPEPMFYGLEKRVKKMAPKVRARIQLLKQDVRSVTAKVDLAIACNFSFNIFKKEEELIDYFKNVRQSLNDQGLFILEISGGPGFIEKVREPRIVKAGKKHRWKYIWEQRSFDPISHDGFYAIHFEFKDGSKMRDAFTYDWRVWSIPELRYLLKQAGFQGTAVFWETEPNQYTVREKGDQDHAWIAHVVGIKKVR